MKLKLTIAVAFLIVTGVAADSQTIGPPPGGGGGTPCVTSALSFQFNNSSSFGCASVYQDGADLVTQRRSTNPQFWKIYNTYTDASNGEWLEAQWNGGNMYLRTQANGTGSPDHGLSITTGGQLSLIGGASGSQETIVGGQGNGSTGFTAIDVYPKTNATYAFGRTGSRWTNGFFSGYVSTNSIYTSGSAPSLSSCGTGSPALLTGSTDMAGEVTEGTTISGCVVTMANTSYGSKPTCVVTPQTESLVTAFNYTIGFSSGTVTITVTNLTGSGFKFNYNCTYFS